VSARPTESASLNTTNMRMGRDGRMGRRTADQGQLDAADDGIEVEIRDIELLLQLRLVEAWPDVGRHVCGRLIGLGNEDLAM